MELRLKIVFGENGGRRETVLNAQSRDTSLNLSRKRNEIHFVRLESRVIVTPTSFFAALVRPAVFSECR